MGQQLLLVRHLTLSLTPSTSTICISDPIVLLTPGESDCSIVRISSHSCSTMLIFSLKDQLLRSITSYFIHALPSSLSLTHSPHTPHTHSHSLPLIHSHLPTHSCNHTQTHALTPSHLPTRSYNHTSPPPRTHAHTHTRGRFTGKTLTYVVRLDDSYAREVQIKENLARTPDPFCYLL